MTLNEAIKHVEEVAEEKERGAGWFYDKESSIYKKKCIKCADRQLVELLKELQAHREAWEKCIKEIKEWYWNADKQAIAKDPCVVDAMIDLFIRTIKECRPKEGDAE